MLVPLWTAKSEVDSKVPNLHWTQKPLREPVTWETLFLAFFFSPGSAFEMGTWNQKTGLDMVPAFKDSCIHKEMIDSKLGLDNTGWDFKGEGRLTGHQVFI